MSFFHLFRCDVCGRQEQIDHSRGLIEYRVPAGWGSLMFNNFGQDRQTKYVCPSCCAEKLCLTTAQDDHHG